MLAALCLWATVFCWEGDRPPPVAPPKMVAVEASVPKASVPKASVPKFDPPQMFDVTCEVQPPDDLKPIYWSAARRYPGGATDCELAKQGWQESRLQADAVSPVGAIGVAQFLPATAAELEVDPWDPGSSIQGQARYVKWTRDRWTLELFGRVSFDIRALGLATYNYGLGNMRKDQDRNGWGRYCEAHAGLPRETRHYVDVIEGAEQCQP